MKQQVLRRRDAERAAKSVGADIAERILTRNASFSLVRVAGGTTPRPAYEFLASVEMLKPSWPTVHVFWGDERCVAADDPQSNYRAAKEALLDRVALPAENVHRIRGELGAEAAAEDAERTLRSHFAPAATPAFDLVLLGMGEDGHTASLFPHNPALAETKRWAVPVETEAKAPRWRVSLTLSALAAAKEVFFLVTGAAKRPVLSEILRDPQGAAARYPAAAVAARARRVVWYVDEDAAGDPA